MSLPVRAVAGAAACALAISACGDSKPDNSARATLPRALADGLATRGETVGSRLDAGDLCGAANEADLLRAEAEAAASSGRVPVEFRAPLRAAVRRLDAQIECPPPPPPAPVESPDEEKLKPPEPSEKKPGKGSEKDEEKDE